MHTPIGKTVKILGVREGMGIDQPATDHNALLDIPSATDTGLPVAIEEDCDCGYHHPQDVDFRPEGGGYEGPGSIGYVSAAQDDEDDEDDDEDDQDDEDDEDDDEDMAAVQRQRAVGRVHLDDVHRVVADDPETGRDPVGNWESSRDMYQHDGLRITDARVAGKLANARVRSYGVAYYQSQYARPDTMDITEVHPRRVGRDTRRARRADPSGGRHGYPTGPEPYRGRHRNFTG